MIDTPTIRIELQVPAMSITHHLATHNQQIEDQVKEGIENAISELSTKETIGNMVKDAILKQVECKLKNNIFSHWDAWDKLKANLSKAITDQTEIYAKSIV